jgi:hypothetical protein
MILSSIATNRIINFLGIYVNRILTQIENTTVIRENSNSVVIGENETEMLCIVDLSKPQNKIKEFEITIENNELGKKFAEFANALLFGLKNSELSTYFHLQSLQLPHYQLENIKFTKRFSYDSTFSSDFKDRILKKNVKFQHLKDNFS